MLDGVAINRRIAAPDHRPCRIPLDTHSTPFYIFPISDATPVAELTFCWLLSTLPNLFTAGVLDLTSGEDMLAVIFEDKKVIESVPSETACGNIVQSCLRYCGLGGREALVLRLTSESRKFAGRPISELADWLRRMIDRERDSAEDTMLGLA